MTDGISPTDALSTRDALENPRRLAALHRAALLDTPADAAFDRLTRLATIVLGVPVSLVSLVDADRQFFKSQQGLPDPWASQRQTPLTHSFCQHVVVRNQPLVIEDARHDPLLRDNRAIDELGVVAYAGFPIMSADGQVIGSFCAIDHHPRRWTETELEVLRELASLAHTELELRAALDDADVAARDAERASAERAAVIESSSDGIYTVDLSGHCTLANGAASATLGYDMHELLGADMHELVHHHHADGTPFPEAECPLYHAFRDATTTRVDGTTFWRKDGSSFPAECTSSPLFIDGALAGAVVAFRDVTERVVAAEALRESEMKFRAVFEDAGVGIVITDLDGGLLDCNEAYERLTGYHRNDLLSTTFAQITHPDDAVTQRRLADEMLAGAIPQLEMEKRYIRPDGELIWGHLTATLMRDPNGSPRFIVGAVEDITAQRRAAEAMRLLAETGALLAESLEYERTVLAVARRVLPLMGDACVVDLYGADGATETVCAHVNPAREAALCALRRGRPLVPRVLAADALAPGATLVADIDDVRARLAGDDAEELACLAALGVRSAIHVTLRGRRGALGAITFCSELRRYTADDVRMAEELAARIASAIENALLYREAQSATRARDEVLAVVSHDLRNPVHTITMGASLLTDLPDLDHAAIQTQVAVIRRSAARADRLIRDLLDVTRIENGQLRLDRQPVAAGEVLAEASQMASSQAHQKNLTLLVAEPEPSTVAYADRDRLLQALDNLLGNAVKFTPAGGEIVLSAAGTGEGVRFEVRDTGPGVSPSEQGNLFRRFWQARRVDRRGVGLGLSIVKGIVDAHGGDIDVLSDGRSGTTIRFTIPRRTDIGATSDATPTALDAAAQVRRNA